ncbi:retrovirus-related Pol polyprotein from transposon 17.6 [Trichonephila clavipes]|nr:retrovirus-related Pol polyprotein from transposon 17.6 [Trichonephila clavipes]
MSCKNIKLGDIPIIANSLKCGTTRAVKTLNFILGVTEFDRSSRNKIRNFSTFPKEFRVEEHKEKILTEFSLPDFISVANLLHLNVETNEQNLCNSIFKALTSLDKFQLTLNNSETSFSEGENVVSKTTFQKRITLDRSFSSEGTDQHSPFQYPVSSAPLPSVQTYSFMPAHQNVLSLCTQNNFPPYSNDASLTEMNTQFWTLLRDISATSRKFTGEDFYSVNSFFRDVEENFDLFPATSSSQKLIFAKRLVCGTAKSFLFSQRNLNTYESFKNALIEEFSDSVTSIEIHRVLEKRKMYKTETLMQYFNSMRKLANRCDSKIDEASIIQYVINGIEGSRSDKIILYGATSFSEFKQKLRTYETVIKNMEIHNSNSLNFRHSYESRGRDFKQQSFQRKHTRFNVSDAAKNPQRCSNCNDIGHLSKSCTIHSRGPRCLSCNLYGHKSFECRRVNLNNTSTPPSGVNAVHKLPSPINMCKDVTIFGRKRNGLVDTGSNLTLLRNSTYINIDPLSLKQTNTLLTGFGFSRINVIGTFDSEISIDDQIFPVTISVVPNSCTNYDLIIGCDVIKQAHLNVSPTGVKFAQILRPSDNANENFIMTISDGSPTFDIGPNVSQHNRAEPAIDIHA